MAATEDDKKHVNYILLAEFNIDTGSGLSHQYPAPTGADPHVLAELMLPDGAHKREEDWTIFFLNQEPPNDGRKPVSSNRQSVRRPEQHHQAATPVLEAYVYEFTEANQAWDQIGETRMKIHLEPNAIAIMDGETLIRRIGRNAELQHQSMEPMYHCVISGDAAFGFRFAEDQLERQFETHCEELRVPEVALVKKDEAAKKDDDVEEDPENSKPKPFLYCLNLIRNKLTAEVRRGAVVKSMAICTRHKFIHVYKPLLLLALDRYFKTPDVSVLAELYDAINAMDLRGMPDLTQSERQILRTSGDKEKQVYTTAVNYMKINIPIRCPIAMLEDEVGDPSVVALINKFGLGVMTIYNALLSDKRIMFLGYNRPSHEVAQYVLSACQLVCPPIRGLITRAFPYTNLTYLKFLEFRGYIVGVTNPVFKENSNWWDVLCDMDSGKVIMNPKLPVPETVKHLGMDNEFMAEVLHRIEAHYGEDHIRKMFNDYTQRIAEIALECAEFSDDANKRKEIDGNSMRVEAWKRTMTFKTFSEDRNKMKAARTIKNCDAERHIAKLRVRKTLSAQEIYSIYKDFINSITTEAQLMEFLSYLPENQGGLYPVAVSLLHPAENVRKATAELFTRLAKLKTGSDFIGGMNPFLRLAYERSKVLLQPRKT